METSNKTKYRAIALVVIVFLIILSFSNYYSDDDNKNITIHCRTGEVMTFRNISEYKDALIICGVAKRNPPKINYSLNLEQYLNDR